jgi:hypothetical protein
MKLNITGLRINPELGENHFEPPESAGARWR